MKTEQEITIGLYKKRIAELKKNLVIWEEETIKNTEELKVLEENLGDIGRMVVRADDMSGKGMVKVHPLTEGKEKTNVKKNPPTHKTTPPPTRTVVSKPGQRKKEL